MEQDLKPVILTSNILSNVEEDPERSLSIDEIQTIFHQRNAQIISERISLYDKIEQSDKDLEEKILSKTIDSLRNRISSLQNRINEIKESNQKKKDKDEQILNQFLFEEQRIKSIIKDIDSIKPNIEDVKKPDSVLILAQLEVELYRTLKGHDECITYLSKEMKQLDDLLQSSTKRLEHQILIREKLKNKLVGSSIQNSKIAHLKSSISELSSENSCLIDQMASFLDSNFPIDSNLLNQSIASSSSSSSDAKIISYDSLKQIIRSLLLHLNPIPDASYIQITDKHWKSHIELLLRGGIVVKHPENENLIRLVPFHK